MKPQIYKPKKAWSHLIHEHTFHLNARGTKSKFSLLQYLMQIIIQKVQHIQVHSNMKVLRSSEDFILWFCKECSCFSAR